MTENHTAAIPLNKLIAEWNDYLLNYQADPRTKDMFLITSPYPHMVIFAAYIYVCCYLLPRYMFNRKPLDLKDVVMFYNVFQVAYNSWLVYLSVLGGWFNGNSFLCHPLETNTPKSNIMAYASWWFFLSKYIDWLDTVFIALRKRYKQLSVLHLMHHGAMPGLCWYVVRYLPGGQLSSVGPVNASVHVIMYSYYFLAGLGPEFQKYLWWKKYLTIIQMAQFVILFFHQILLFFVECDFPAYPRYWAFFFTPIIFGLFFAFYRNTYTKKSEYLLRVKERTSEREAENTFKVSFKLQSK